jgi:hypothetical protein
LGFDGAAIPHVFQEFVMKRRFIFRAYMALALLAALAFPGCPLEDEVLSSGTAIRLINVPGDVLGGNKWGFLAVFSDKANIGPREGLMQPLSGHVPKGLKLSSLGAWQNGNILTIPSFGDAVVDGNEYVVVLGLSPETDESTGTTYTTGTGSLVTPVTLGIIKGVAEIDFSEFACVESRDKLVQNIADGTW